MEAGRAPPRALLPARCGDSDRRLSRGLAEYSRVRWFEEYGSLEASARWHDRIVVTAERLNALALHRREGVRLVVSALTLAGIAVLLALAVARVLS